MQLGGHMKKSMSYFRSAVIKYHTLHESIKNICSSVSPAVTNLYDYAPFSIAFTYEFLQRQITNWLRIYVDIYLKINEFLQSVNWFISTKWKINELKCLKWNLGMRQLWKKKSDPKFFLQIQWALALKIQIRWLRRGHCGHGHHNFNREPHKRSNASVLNDNGIQSITFASNCIKAHVFFLLFRHSEVKIISKNRSERMPFDIRLGLGVTELCKRIFVHNDR